MTALTKHGNMSTNAITTQKMAYDTIMSGMIDPITSVTCTEDDFHTFKRSIVEVATSVPTTIGEGLHGHMWLLESNADYQARSNCTAMAASTPTAHPSYDPNDTSAMIATKKAEHQTLVELFHTQEGCKQGLRQQIVRNVPDDAIIELKDPEYGYANMDPEELMQHLQDNCEAVDTVDLKSLMSKRNEQLDFKGKVMLKTRFTQLAHVIKELGRHRVHTQAKAS